MSSSSPPFDPSGTRYDQNTYAGRLAHFREMVSPSTLLVTDTELQAKVDLLERHARGAAPEASDAELWDAKRLKDAVIHPTTGEKMFLPGRMSAFVPVNTVPTVGMLVAATPAQIIFWQWLNQSVNVMCNYVNRSGASVEWSQIGQAYALAVGVSCGIAVGARKLVQAGRRCRSKVHWPWKRRRSPSPHGLPSGPPTKGHGLHAWLGAALGRSGAPCSDPNKRPQRGAERG